MNVPERGPYDGILDVPGVLPPVLDAGATDRSDGDVREAGLRLYELYQEDEKTKKSLENEPERLTQSEVKGITSVNKKLGAYRAIYCCEDEPISTAKGNG